MNLSSLLAIILVFYDHLTDLHHLCQNAVCDSSFCLRIELLVMYLLWSQYFILVSTNITVVPNKLYNLLNWITKVSSIKNTFYFLFQFNTLYFKVFSLHHLQHQRKAFQKTIKRNIKNRAADQYCKKLLWFKILSYKKLSHCNWFWNIKLKKLLNDRAFIVIFNCICHLNRLNTRVVCCISVIQSTNSFVHHHTSVIFLPFSDF